MNSIPVLIGQGADEDKVKEILRKLNSKAYVLEDEVPEEMLHLKVDENGVSLEKGSLSMQGDFSHMIKRVSHGKIQHEVLAKVAKVKGLEGHMTAIDATAGMGEDSMIIAAAGYHVKLFEKNTVIGILLKDAIERAGNIPELAAIASRMEFVEGDSIDAMRSLERESVDLIYLDPMFPARSKSGLVKKKFQLLQQLESPGTDGDVMLQVAMDLAPRKLVIKRPAKGENLGGIQPGYSVSGKAIRYDCFVFPRNK